MGVEFDTLSLDDFDTILGKVSLPFYAMLNGLPGSGKSTLSLMLAKKMNEKGLKVLFISHEEGFSYTLQEKIKRLAIDNITFATDIKSVQSKIMQYDVVFMDSIQSMNIGIEQFKELIKKGKNRNTSFVFIFQSTKEGNYKGGSQYEHEVDISLSVEQGTAKVRKSRFGGRGELVVF